MEVIFICKINTDYLNYSLRLTLQCLANQSTQVFDRETSISILWNIPATVVESMTHASPIFLFLMKKDFDPSCFFTAIYIDVLVQESLTSSFRALFHDCNPETVDSIVSIVIPNQPEATKKPTTYQQKKHSSEMPCPLRPCLLMVSVIYFFCVGTVNSLLQQVKSASNSISMDPMAMLKIPIFKPLFRNIIGTSTNLPPTSNLLPWKQSIDANRQLSYMPMLQEQLDTIQSLEGIKEITIPENFVYQTSKVKPAQIGNMCFATEKFRKIRMTYFDAGDNVQVYFIWE